MGKVETEIGKKSGAYLFHTGKVEESRFVVPEAYAQNSRGYSRCPLVDRSVGSVHMGVDVCRLEARGEVASRIHAYEKGIYVLEGELEVRRDSEFFRLPADGYAFIPFAVSHGIRNTGAAPARWFEMQAPQPKLPGGWQDTHFVDGAAWPAEVIVPDLSDPRTHYVGQFKAQKPMIRDAAGIRGLKVYRFMEREFGAQHFFMMRGELAAGGVRGRHDHAVEEVYLGLSGEADIEIEGERYHLGPGDFAWTGVGTCHAFFQKGNEPFRWIETQSPQFPEQHASRNYAAWEKLRVRTKNP
jgi:mannose-6-phosphate isomerase-like protein (cupin superfamily)